MRRLVANILLFWFCAQAELQHQRGLAPFQRVANQATFECFDGSRKIPLSSVNDDFCDCLGDGSDEPGTSACSHIQEQAGIQETHKSELILDATLIRQWWGEEGVKLYPLLDDATIHRSSDTSNPRGGSISAFWTRSNKTAVSLRNQATLILRNEKAGAPWGFYCPQLNGAAPKFISHWKVDDGVCDCCDGADEKHFKCPNICGTEYQEAKEKNDSFKAIVERLYRLKSDRIREGKIYFDSLLKINSTMESEISALKLELENAIINSTAAHNSSEVAKSRGDTSESRSVNDQTESLITAEVLPTDETDNGMMDDYEPHDRAFEDEMDFEDDEALLDESDHVDDQPDVDEETPEHHEEAIKKPGISEYAKWMDRGGAVASSTSTVAMSFWGKITSGWQKIIDRWGATRKPEIIQASVESSRDTGKPRTSSRSPEEILNDQIASKTERLENARRLVAAKQIGDFPQLLHLAGQCMSKSGPGGHKFHFCPFDRAFHDEGRTGIVEVGEYEGIILSRPTNLFGYGDIFPWAMKFYGGAVCDGNATDKPKKREAKVFFVCADVETAELIDVKEEETCVYTAIIGTPGVCGETLSEPPPRSVKHDEL